jgi:hypothetical protein
MAAIGTNVVTSIVNRYIMPEIVDNIYNSNPLWYRLNRANKKVIRGGNNIEVPLMYKRFNNGGFYSGLDVLDVAPNDTVLNAVFDWKQAYMPVSFSGLTLAKTDAADAIVNIIQFTMDQAELEMAEVLADGLWSDGSNALEIDGLQAAINDTTVATYGGLSRTTHSWWNSTVTDASSGGGAWTSADFEENLNTAFTNAVVGGRAPTCLVSGRDQYNRFWGTQTGLRRYPTQPTGADEQLAAAGFHNITFNGVPWMVDSHTPETIATYSDIFMLNEDYFYWVVNSRADFYLEPFQTPVQQDAIVAKMLWYGNFINTNCARQARVTGVGSGVTW